MTPTDEQVERVAARFDHALQVALVAEALLKGFWFSDEKQAVRAARAAIAALPPQGDGLAELRALSEKATPGEWVIWGLKSSHGHLTIGIETETGPTKHVCEMSWGRDSHERGASGGDDAAFIVACVNHVRRALAGDAG